MCLLHVNVFYIGCLDTGVLEKSSGGFQGPDDLFNSKTLCTWLIKAPAKHYIELIFSYSSIRDRDCSFAYLEVYDGDSPTSGSFGRFCQHFWNKVIKSEKSSMYVTLYVDSTFKSNGVPTFSATYKAVKIKNHAGKFRFSFLIVIATFILTSTLITELQSLTSLCRPSNCVTKH